MIFSPELGSRVKQTPVPEVSPVFPKTICTTLTAVPRRPVIFSTRRYVTAFSAIQEPKTAPIAPHSWSIGSSGKSFPDSLRKYALYSATSSLQPLAGFCGYRKSHVDQQLYRGHLVEIFAFAAEEIASCSIAFRFASN